MRELRVLGLVLLVAAGGLSGCGGKAPYSARPVVAPLFEHGDGCGDDDRRSWDRFLPEDEALKIITDRLAARGLAFSERDTQLAGVTVRQRVRDWTAGTKALAYLQYSTGWNLPFREHRVVRELDPDPVWVDIRDPRHRVVVEYVSKEDYYDLGGLQRLEGYEHYDLMGVAESLLQAAENDGCEDVFLVVFYDPVVRKEALKTRVTTRAEGDRALAEVEALAKIQAGELLEKQVEDAMAWLESQGVI